MIFPASLSPRRSGLGEFDGLVGLNLAGHRRFVRVHDGLDDGGSGIGESLAQNGLGLFRPLDGVAASSAGFCDLGEVDGLKVHAEFGIAVEDHLLPFDLTKGVVLDHDDFDVKPVFDERGDLAHEHGEATVADDADDLAGREGDGGPDGVGKAVGHGGEGTGE